MPVAGVGNCGQNDDGTLGPIIPSNWYLHHLHPSGQFLRIIMNYIQ
jgi:hypothetical protein